MTLLDKSQAKKRPSVSSRKLDYLVAAGELKAMKIGRRTLFRDIDLDQFEASLPTIGPKPRRRRDVPELTTAGDTTRPN
ncbi:MAG: hypothetical protein JSR21_07135 [Proteobacteria bacterium]|nr:hypothetical protein [Pseudomonadota bacterium]